MSHLFGSKEGRGRGRIVVLRGVNIIIVDGIFITDSSTVHSYFCSEVFMHHKNDFMIVLEL